MKDISLGDNEERFPFPEGTFVFSVKSARRLNLAVGDEIRIDAVVYKVLEFKLYGVQSTSGNHLDVIHCEPVAKAP